MIIVGDNQEILAAEYKTEDMFDKMEEETTTVSIEIRKSMNKYVNCPKRSTIAEILQIMLTGKMLLGDS